MDRTKAALTTGALAREAGVHLETIRFYEKRGLVPEPARNASGYRQYTADAVQRVRFIKRAQELGFTLEEIGELLELRAHPNGRNARVRRLADLKLETVDAKIRDLQRMRKELRALTSACDGRGTVASCPIIAAIEEKS
jgi:Hg(II)-responsive transcriptional regulator